MARVKHFKTKEFACPCDCGRHAKKMNRDFIVMLDDARSISGIPFKITSGYRCPAYNKSVGGSKNSAHMRGLAADIAIKNSLERILAIQAVLDAGFERIGIGPDFIHVDNDLDLPYPVMWDYYK
jgi:zinc D-Ala-D-Ala carboxypeptidase